MGLNHSERDTEVTPVSAFLVDEVRTQSEPVSEQVGFIHRCVSTPHRFLGDRTAMLSWAR